MAEAARKHRTDIDSLGGDIRQLRKARGLTLQDLATRTGKSIGFLSQVERNLTKPSVGALQDISDALGVHIGWFFQVDTQADTVERQYIVRKEHRRRISYSELSSTDYLGLYDHLLSANLTGRLVLGYSRYEPGASTGDDTYHHDGEEAGLVLFGLLELTIGGDVFTLREGDSFSFPSDKPHKFANPSQTDETIVVWANTPITLMR
jgi:transcriptional regulator with XRE-family HTH domain